MKAKIAAKLGALVFDEKTLGVGDTCSKVQLEKTETFFGRRFFAAALDHFPIARRGQIGKGTAVQHSARIVFEQRGRQLFAFGFCKQIESRFQAQRTSIKIVRVAGDEMNRVCVEQEFRGFLSAASKTAGERLGSYLNEAALAQPSPEAFPLGTDQRVAFGMSNYQLKAIK